MDYPVSLLKEQVMRAPNLPGVTLWEMWPPLQAVRVSRTVNPFFYILYIKNFKKLSFLDR